MKKYFLTFYLIFISIVFFCCDKIETRILYIKNDSKSAITCLITKKELNLTGKGESFLYVDLEPNEEGDLNPGKPSWERLIEKCDGEKLHFYIVNQDSINKYGLDTVFKKICMPKNITLQLRIWKKLIFI